MIHNEVVTLRNPATNRVGARCASGCTSNDIVHLFPTPWPSPVLAAAEWKVAVVNGSPLRVTLQVGGCRHSAVCGHQMYGEGGGAVHSNLGVLLSS